MLPICYTCQLQKPDTIFRKFQNLYIILCVVSIYMAAHVRVHKSRWLITVKNIIITYNNKIDTRTCNQQPNHQQQINTIMPSSLPHVQSPVTKPCL